MRVVEVEVDTTGKIERVWFEHNNVRWFKYYPYKSELKDWLNDLIKDVKIRV